MPNKAVEALTRQRYCVNMISESISQLLSIIQSRYEVADQGYLRVLYIIATLALLLLTWRIWTFTILPVLHPQEPKQLPYWIPGRRILLG